MDTGTLAPTPAQPTSRSRATLPLGLEGFVWKDLHDPVRLADLTAAFDRVLEAADPALYATYQAHRSGQARLMGSKESDLLVAVAGHLSAFVGKLFGVEEPLRALREQAGREAPLFRVRREFVQRRSFKKGAANRPAAAEFPALEAQVQALLAAARAVEPFSALAEDPELSAALFIERLLEAEKALAVHLDPNKPGQLDAAAFGRWRALAHALSSAGGHVPAAPALLTLSAASAPAAPDLTELAALRALLDLCDRWCFALTLHHDGHRRAHGWTLLRVPHALDFEKLVQLRIAPLAAKAGHADAIRGLEEHQRRRDGFALTDPRMNRRETMGEVDYCIYCHDREKDSCSSGFREKSEAMPKARLTGRDAEGSLAFKKNPLGIPLTGCPLEERISEAHLMQKEGDAVAALAVICVDNPMTPGTGHRICNDCMKACIYQKQEPVNIPQAETGILTDVLKLRWGFEIWSLLTRWNPLKLGKGDRQHPRPYAGVKAMVVGMGPAGYTLSHHLCNEGFFVAGIDGLKVEPLPADLLGRAPGQDGVPNAIEWLDETFAGATDTRITSGFGGVSEYGITVRWDKRFLDILHVNLARRSNFVLYGGTRFGGTITLEDAWALGFDHVALAAGAGKPTVIGLKNNLIRGIRKASDFLMALQLTGAFKEDALANLQVRLPAVVIGGGLTAVDTATELAAYYPVQVEKLLGRHEVLSAELGEEKLLSTLDAEEREVYGEYLGHGRAVLAERARARTAGEAPDFAKLVNGWGGVTLAYRKGLNDSPAYRLNHEEVSKALEEGIAFAPGLTPVEAVADQYGAVASLKFTRADLVAGQWKESGETVELPARTVCVAAGTSPNVTLGKENPSQFEMDPKYNSFKSYQAVPDAAAPGGVRLEPAAVSKDLSGEAGFFTSYNHDGKLVSYFGDNHPFYAGSVVKAMASAKDGYRKIVTLFSGRLAEVDVQQARPAFVPAQASRDAGLAALRAKLDDELVPRIFSVNRLTPTIVEVVVRAPAAARRFLPGQFYRLQNYESLCARVDGTPLLMEGLALTGAWTDPERGLIGTIVLEMGGSSSLCSLLRPGFRMVLMGPTGAPSTIPQHEDVVLCGGGLGNAVLFSIGKALKVAGCRVIYFAGYRNAGDVFKREDIEASADVIVWSVDKGGTPPEPRRPQDRSFTGNMVEAMVAYATGKLGEPAIPFKSVKRIIAIGSDRMMAAVSKARHTEGQLKGLLPAEHVAIASINSPMQCMMKEICAQCLQKCRDPKTGKESVIFTCFDQDQEMDRLDWDNLRARLRQGSLQEKLGALWIARLLERGGIARV